MGYFDSVKPKPSPPTLVPARPNVIPLRGEMHPYARAIRSAWLTRLDSLPRPWIQGAAWDNNCFVAARKLIELANSPWAGYAMSAAKDDYLAHAPRDNVWDKREKCWDQAVKKSGAFALPEPDPQAPLPTVTILDLDTEVQSPADVTPDLSPAEEDMFWDERPILDHIRSFAQARRVSPWAVLGVTLARIITATPHQVCLPPIVGGKASLNLFVGLVGPSGSGKGAAESVAADAVHVGHIVTHNVGSGEGIAHGYKYRSKGDLHWHDDDHAVLFSVPEIDSLAAQGFGRKGATLMPQLRSAWTGEQLGFGYADPTKRIIVEAHQYRLCMVAGIQPGRAGCLLDDADGGTPQRFLWLPATDPDAPDVPPAEPRTRTWTAPPTGNFVSTGGARIEVCQTARDTIVQARLDRLRGVADEALDGHMLLCRLKVAAALAIADERYVVTDEDWDLSDVVMRKSAATRAGVVALLRMRAQQETHGRAEAEATKALIVAERVEDAAVKRVCGVVVRKLRKEGEWVPRGELRRTAGRDRHLIDDALTRLLDAGQIEVEETSKGTRFKVAEGGHREGR